ncbi:uncharacterized protein LOC120358693 [Solenopsis invicta]|uniref:uncharacterized protein LOC120358693 n=1 Tax=Solenopsis invicta TaxID=13686 RepID=UPI00193DCFBC|nr:uncharacterized protein LOC120358693 [Solenopsis invicta]
MLPQKEKPIITENVIKSASELSKKSNVLINKTRKLPCKPVNEPLFIKVQDLRKLYVAEKKKSEQLEAALESAKIKIKDLKAMNNEMTGLNMKLQKTVISYVKQLTDGKNNTIPIKPHENIMKDVPAVSMIHKHDKKVR